MRTVNGEKNSANAILNTLQTQEELKYKRDEQK